MNCQEVMDYMQRQLDGDLDEQETEILMTHTRQCSECAAMFERLKLLSSGLESLPKVTPSYSLVDAILPRLAELQTTADLPGHVPHIVIAGEPVSPAGQTAPAKNRWKKWLPVSALGGVVAAGVMVGMFFLSHQSNYSLIDNDSGISVADSAASNSSASTDDSADANTSKMTDGSDRAAAADEVPAAQGAANNKVEPDTVVSKKGAARNVDPNGETMPPLSNGDVARTEVEGSANTPNYEVSTDSNLSPAADSAGNSTKAAGGTAASTDKHGTESDKEQAFTSSAVMASPISVDNKFQAFIVDNSVKIYTVSDSLMIFQSVTRTGISNLKWAADSTSLTYEAVSADGSKHTYVVDPNAATEQEQVQSIK
ncbi:anti-sigma factor [Paenibacillus sp. R14(2021)]|uniref:anti-sigma factor family protein n=1 Tax=Paenibacillus sp. R14(2021) TaxID=2859228 RepID=UPI001C612ECB|nr:zf-HC2 domain-containing protein [Paenibacillus sp. R14(2021)]